MAATAHLKEVKSVSDEFITDNWNNLENSAQEWVNQVRSNALRDVQEQGLPTPKSERYKYTNLPAFLKGIPLEYKDTAVQVQGQSSYTSALTKKLDADTPEWVKAALEQRPAGHYKYGDMALWQAGNAFLGDGIVVDVPKNTHGEEALNITISGDKNALMCPRILIRVGENAEFTVIETHNGQGTFWNNQITQVILEQGAKLHHYRVLENSDESAYTQNTHIHMQRDANYETFVLTKGSGLSRNQVHVEMLGENAECTLNGANLLADKQHADTTITIEHKAPHCVSHQNYRYVLDGQSTGVFQGKVHVHQIAQKTDGYQKSDTLLLSDRAQMNTKPELEIYADDVKCSHGTTTGKLEDTPLFYLRSRGIPEDEARAMLIQSFVGEVVEQIVDDFVQEIIQDKVAEWLKRSK